MHEESHQILNDFTVIIPTVGRPILKMCLDSIASGNVLPKRVIAIDQGENPAVANWLHNLEALGIEITHLHSTEKSPASARNQGIEQVHTTFVAAIDDDCVAETNWLEKMEILLNQNDSALITGRLEPTGEGIPPATVTSTIPRVYKRPSIRSFSPLTSANMGFSLETAQRIGRFDEKLIAAEDNDWAHRALSLGIPIIYMPELVVYHHHWRDTTQLADTYRTYAWGQGAFFGKYLRRGDLSMVLRTIIYFYRGLKLYIKGTKNNNYDLQTNGCARITQLHLGLVAGIRGQPQNAQKRI